MIQKAATLAIVFVLVASSLLMAPVNAEVPKPSVPEFVIETVSFPYDVPSTATINIDPYTGKETVTTQPGYHVENKTTQLKIRNQPFASFEIQENNNNWTINLYYNIRLKGHFAQNWSYYRLYNGSSDGNLRQAAGSGYTIVGIDSYLPYEGQMDFQIEALVGYEQGIVSCPGAPGTARVITGETSGWSAVQTVTIENSQVSSLPNLTGPPTTMNTPQSTTASTTSTGLFGLGWEVVAIVGLVVAVVVLALGLLVVWRRLASLKSA